MTAKAKVSNRVARPLIGQPVYIELIDGRQYVGWLTNVGRGELMVSGHPVKMTKANTSKLRKKVRTSSFLPGLLGSMLGGGGGLGSMLGGGGLGSLLGGGGLGSMLGGGGQSTSSPSGAAAQQQGSSGGGNVLGSIGNMWSMMRIGFGIVKTIMPLMGMLKI